MNVSLSDLQYADAQNGAVNMTVTGWLDAPIPFTYHPADTAPLSVIVGQLLDWQQIAAYVAPAPVVPASVTRAQAKIQLLRAGILDQVKTAVAAAGGEMQIWFDDATTWERNNSHVVALGAGLGLTSQQIDDLFTAAAQIA